MEIFYVGIVKVRRRMEVTVLLDQSSNNFNCLMLRTD